MRFEFIEAFYAGVPLAIGLKYVHGKLHNDIFPNDPYPTGELATVMAITAFILGAITATIFVWFKYSHVSLGLLLSHTFSFFTYIFPSLCFIGLIYHTLDNKAHYVK